MSAAVITANEFAQLAEIVRAEASRILKRAHESEKPWRKVLLRVSWIRGNGGRQRVVEVESLPSELQAKYWKRQALDVGIAPENADNFTCMREAAKRAPGKRKVPTNEKRKVPAHRDSAAIIT